MFKKFYLQIVALISVSLILFVSIIFVLLQHFEYIFYDNDLIAKGPVLLEYILPEDHASPEDYKIIIPALEADLEVQVTVISPNRQIIWGKPLNPDIRLETISVGMWYITHDETRWTTRLRDGRWVSVKIPTAPIREEIDQLIPLIISMAIVISLFLYPVIRNMTARLERLNKSVQQIGHNDLGPRVTVEGHDEIATLATNFNGALARMDKLLASQKMLLANASHELRTPLARIRLGFELLNKKNPNLDKYSLRDDIQELDLLIEELLTLSRLIIDRKQITLAPVNLTVLIEYEVGKYEGIDVSCAGNAIISGNARLLCRLMRNLLDNAHIHGKSPIRVSLKTLERQIELIVQDSGAGIPVGEVKNLLTPFARGPNKQSTPGHGLGLSIVNEIVILHEATLDIRKNQIVIHFPISV